jgi:hypothetical protein
MLDWSPIKTITHSLMSNQRGTWFLLTVLLWTLKQLWFVFWNAQAGDHEIQLWFMTEPTLCLPVGTIVCTSIAQNISDRLPAT